MDAFTLHVLLLSVESGLLMMIEEFLISGKRGQIIICLLILKGYFVFHFFKCNFFLFQVRCGRHFDDTGEMVSDLAGYMEQVFRHFLHFWKINILSLWDIGFIF